MEQNIEMQAYNHRVPIQIRFNDVDRYGHVNNNSYFAYYDLGKEDYLCGCIWKLFSLIKTE